MREKEKIYPNLVLNERWRLIKQINKGGMNSVIWLVSELKNDKRTQWDLYFEKLKVAKIIAFDKGKSEHHSMINKIKDEINTNIRLMKLTNYSPKIYDFFLFEDYIIVIFQYIEGPSLADYLEEKQILPLNEALYIFEEILKAVNELHSIGINESISHKVLHRDLKPENILLTKDYSSIKLIDFGINTIIEEIKDKNLRIKQKNRLISDEDILYGSAPYLTPDALKIDGKNKKETIKIVNEHFDIFPLGIILYRMLTGKMPFIIEEDNIEMIKKPTKFDFESNDLIPAAIENIIFRCVCSKEEDLKNRYKNVQEIIDDLKKYQENPQKIVLLIKKHKDRNYEKKKFFQISKNYTNLPRLLMRKYLIIIWIFSLLIIIIVFLLRTFIISS